MARGLEPRMLPRTCRHSSLNFSLFDSGTSQPRSRVHLGCLSHNPPSTDGGIRTLNPYVLSVVPLPIGLHRRNLLIPCDLLPKTPAICPAVFSTCHPLSAICQKAICAP